MNTLEELSEAQKYDLMSALRGPDDFQFNAALVFKVQVTARLRSIAFGPETGGAYWPRPAWVDYPLRKYELDQLKAARKEIPSEHWGSFMHYNDHLVGAVSVTRDHPIWGGMGKELLAVLRGFEES
jgi:hypothetical protein